MFLSIDLDSLHLVLICLNLMTDGDNFFQFNVLGFMLPSEQAIIDGLSTQYNKFYVPFVWAATLIAQARREGRVSNDFSFQTLIDVSCSHSET